LSRAFAKLRNVTISLVVSVRVYEWSNLVPTRRIFVKFNTWVFFENLSKV